MLLPSEPVQGMDCPPICVPVAFHINPYEDTYRITSHHLSSPLDWGILRDHDLFIFDFLISSTVPGTQ